MPQDLKDVTKKLNKGAIGKVLQRPRAARYFFSGIIKMIGELCELPLKRQFKWHILNVTLVRKLFEFIIHVSSPGDPILGAY
jgi:hypothetical protein